MSRLISDILNAPEPHFSRSIQEWERLNNNAGHDLRLVSDIAAARKSTLKGLGLDHRDTTPRELYYALRHKAVETNARFERKAGIKPEDTPEQVADKVVKFIESLKLPKNTWAVKPAAVKKILKKQPPKKTLKALGLRSIDSVLKRSNPCEILAIARRVEGQDWAKKISQQIRSLSVTDFDSVKIEVSTVSAEKSARLTKAGLRRGSIVTGNYETGTILIIPPTRRFDVDSLGLTLLVLHEIRETEAYGAYFRHISVKNDFGPRLQLALKHGLPGKIYNGKIGWKPLQKHLAHNQHVFEKVEQPYLQQPHLESLPVFSMVQVNIPDGDFWKNSHLVFMNEGDKIASSHLMDVIINASNKLPYEKSASHYLKSAIWEDLSGRYLHAEPLLNAVIIDLDEEYA